MIELHEGSASHVTLRRSADGMVTLQGAGLWNIRCACCLPFYMKQMAAGMDSCRAAASAALCCWLHQPQQSMSHWSVPLPPLHAPAGAHPAPCSCLLVPHLSHVICHLCGCRPMLERILPSAHAFSGHNCTLNLL